MAKESSIKEQIGFRKSEKPKPVFVPKCENCRRYGYDSWDSYNSRGVLVSSRRNQQCGLHGIKVTSISICNDYDSKYPNKVIEKNL